jgi:hypothetical protein
MREELRQETNDAHGSQEPHDDTPYALKRLKSKGNRLSETMLSYETYADSGPKPVMESTAVLMFALETPL